MGRSRIGWALGVVAPWCLGMGLLVSFTASAGQDYESGVSRAPIDSRAVLQPDDLVPSSALIGNLGSFASTRGVLREARLSIGPASELMTLPDEIDPRTTLKPHPGHFPQAVRATRGDPVVGLRPSFVSKLVRPNGQKALVVRDLMFNADDNTIASAFQSYDAHESGPDSVAKFEPWDEDDAPTPTAAVHAASPGASPSQGGSSITFRPAAIAARIAQGATPAVPRAVSLASNTPAPADATPVEVVAVAGAPRVESASSAERNATVIPRSADGRPDYLALIGPDKLADEKKCLAQAVYFEARGEPDEGQAAVAQVVLNRVWSGLYPSSICGVVFQNRHRYRACQFSFACEGRSLRVNDQDSWERASRIADEVLDGRTWIADIGGATHYHADYVRPRWARHLKKMDVIGRHIFYRLKEGQT
ncbi:MAG: cell wall hydrolase [Hyphomicrobiales bacterium]|nr:cell wall hydrolase [Hyphomicrobiales bacterium]